MSGAPGGIVCDPKLYEKSVVCSCVPTHGQYFCGGLSQPFRWDSFVGSLQSGSCSMEWALTCNIFISAEHIAGNLNVSADWESCNFLDSSNWKLCPEIFRSLKQIRGPCMLDLFEDHLNCQTSPILQLETGPNGVSHGCVSTELVNREELSVSPFCLMRCLVNLRVEGGKLILVTPLWPTQAWYPSILHMSIAPPVLLPWTPTSLRSLRAITPSSGQSHPSTSCVACVRQSLQAQGISGNAAKLIVAAWRPGTYSVYNSAWNKWHSWCDERKIDSFCPTLANITAFFAHLELTLPV